MGTVRSKVFVTGANGFIGTELIANLSSASDNVVACCRPGKALSVSRSRTVTVSDINGSTNWTSALQGVASIVHTAARVHVMSDKATNPLEAYRRVNTEGTLNLARQSASLGVRRFVFLSSVKVNGAFTSVHSAFKASDAVEPDGPYGQSKYEAEEGLREISRKTGLEVVIVRAPLVYGSGARANFALLARCLRLGLPLPFKSIVENRRSLVSVENLIDFLSVCLISPRAANRTFMVSDGEDLSTSELLSRMARAMGYKARLFPVPSPLLYGFARILGQQQLADRLLGSLRVDIKPNQELLGWRPPLSVDRGLSNALNGRDI